MSMAGMQLSGPAFALVLKAPCPALAFRRLIFESLFPFPPWGLLPRPLSSILVCNSDLDCGACSGSVALPSTSGAPCADQAGLKLA